MSVFCECRVLSGVGPCDELITRAEKPSGGPGPPGGYGAMGEKRGLQVKRNRSQM